MSVFSSKSSHPLIFAVRKINSQRNNVLSRPMSVFSSKSSHPLIFAVRKINSQRSAAPAHLIRGALHPQTFNFVDQLTQTLKSNCVLHEPGRFVIIPKPYGVSCLGVKQEDGGVFSDSVHDKKDDERAKERRDQENPLNSVTISDCIPSLSRIFNEPKLTFCVGLKRYLSGAIVLPCSGTEFENLKKSIKYATRSSEEGFFHHRSLALLLGSPPEKRGALTGYATFQAVGKHTEYKFVPGRAKRRAKSGKFAVEGTMEWRVIDQKHGCSLVEFAVSKFARHLPRLMFSHLLCPIMGDTIYGNRMSIVDGKPVLLNPANANKNAKLWFPAALSARLDSPVADLRRTMPLYCHVYQTMFPRYGWSIGRPKSQQEDVADLVASCPPPPHFLAMVQALEMNDSLTRFFNEEDTENADSTVVSGDRTF